MFGGCLNGRVCNSVTFIQAVCGGELAGSDGQITAS